MPLDGARRYRSSIGVLSDRGSMWQTWPLGQLLAGDLDDFSIELPLVRSAR
jgi:hypothetical protein